MKKRSSVQSGAMQKSSSMRIGPGPEITTLQNGVRIVSEYIPDVLSFSLGIWIASGSRDEEKGKCDVAKNDFEGMIYKFRDWLREDENEPYIKEDKREELLSELSEHESWLDDATDEIGYKVYEDKFKNLSK